MANEQNLKPFTGADDPRKGNGPKKGSIHIKTLAKRIFEDPDTWERLPVDRAKIKELKAFVGNDKTFGEALIYAWLSKSVSDPRFANLVLELTDGKAKLEHSVDKDLFDTTELTIKVVRSGTDSERKAVDSQGAAE